MTNAISEDIVRLRSELAGADTEIEVTLRLPRSAAEKVLTLLDAEESYGAMVIPAKHEFTTTQAAAVLGMSRPTLMKLLDAGRIGHRMVGRHHRIPASAIQTYRERQRTVGEATMTALGELSNRVGQLD
ncbi:MAG: helix-turn-helix domain-containing protein [Propionibacteriaceae bacterium]|jgi:excisionase family DNA binding protein|nr:helix-turn-helix domain-containing protein [Propionibacteriaceae bacterium]